MMFKFKIDNDLNIVSWEKPEVPDPGKPFKLIIDDREYTTWIRNLKSGLVSIARTIEASGFKITRAELCARHGLRAGDTVYIELVIPLQKYRLSKIAMKQEPELPRLATQQTVKPKSIVGDSTLIKLFISCLREILERGWSHEVRENRERASLGTIDRIRFFHEYAFCVFAAFFRWSIVDAKWQDLTRIFRNWDYDEIYRHKDEVEREAMKVLGNRRKINSILKCVEKLHREGWDKFKARLLQADFTNQLELLDDLPGIGIAAKYQLAGAIGIDVAKPDRYLLDFASKYGYPRTENGVQDFTKRISNLVGERMKVVDYVLWRWSEGSSNAQSES